METTAETWQGTTDSIVVTFKTDKLGQITRVKTQGVAPLTITPEDRELTQERIVEKKNDPFENGLLAPISVVDRAMAEKAAANPNIMTEDDMQKLLSAPAKEFAEKIMSVNSEAIVRRLRNLARDADIRPSRQELIQERLNDIAPPRNLQSSLPEEKPKR